MKQKVTLPGARELDGREGDGGHGDDGVGRVLRGRERREGGECGLGFDHSVERGLVDGQGGSDADAWPAAMLDGRHGLLCLL